MERKNYIVAMDPGSSSITIAVGAPAGDGKVFLADIITRPMQGISRGEIANRQQVSASVSEAVREVEQKHNIRISDVYTGVSGRHIKCTNHDYFVFVGERSDGEIRKEDVAALHDGMNNVQAEDGIRILERIPQSYVIDGRDSVKDPVGMFGKRLESTFNFVLGSSTLLDRMEKTLLALGVSSRRTFANPLASAEAVVLPEEKEMGVAVIDLGAGTTDLCVYHDNAVRFVRGIPFGAADINNDIHQQGILEKRVEDLKKTFGVAMVDSIEIDNLIKITGRSPREKQDISQKNLAIIIENRLREIIGFVMAEIGDSGYAGRLKGGIVLTGGGAQLTGIDDLFRRETGMDVRIALPDVNVADESIGLAQDPAHASVIGILLKAVQDKGAGRSESYTPPPVRQAPVTPPVHGVETPRTGGHQTVNDIFGNNGGNGGDEEIAGTTNDPDNDGSEEVINGKPPRKSWLERLKDRFNENIFFPDTLDGDEDI